MQLDSVRVGFLQEQRHAYMRMRVRATIASEWDAIRRELAEGRHRQLQAGLSSGHRVLHHFCGSDLDWGTP
jgi:hypothetical protein